MVKFINKGGEKELDVPITSIEEIKRRKIVIKDYLIVKTKVG